MLILCFIIHGTMNLLSNTCYISQYMGCHRIINMMTSSKIILKFWQLPRPLTTSWPHPWPLATSWPFATPPGHLLAVDLIILWPAYLVTLAENSDLESPTMYWNILVWMRIAGRRVILNPKRWSWKFDYPVTGGTKKLQTTHKEEQNFLLYSST